MTILNCLNIIMEIMKDNNFVIEKINYLRYENKHH